MRFNLKQFFQQEDLNFLLTNRIPRIFLTRLMGKLSKINHPFIAGFGIKIWQLFADLDLSEAKKTHFSSLHDCFTRELKPGARPIDMRSDIIASPCDAIIGAFGDIRAGELFQAKGFPYQLEDLLPENHLLDTYNNGKFITLRLTSSMYHRFHAPFDCRVNHVSYISGDTWNVNPITLRRIEKLFCKNERAVISTSLLPNQQPLTLVAVAAVLVASIRLHGVDSLLSLEYKGANEISCDRQFTKGEEMGWFEHGSTIILFVPANFSFVDGLETDVRIRMGEALLRLT